MRVNISGGVEKPQTAPRGDKQVPDQSQHPPQRAAPGIKTTSGNGEEGTGFHTLWIIIIKSFRYFISYIVREEGGGMEGRCHHLWHCWAIHHLCSQCFQQGKVRVSWVLNLNPPKHGIEAVCVYCNYCAKSSDPNIIHMQILGDHLAERRK